MAKLNKLYRAFIDYRKVTAVDSDLKRDRKSYKLIDKELEYFEAIKVKCTIEEDWVKEIEKKMEYVTKAVNEERQFIETIGEVVPIEKVKKVSKDSVKHLAKHSNLITKVPENEDEIIPEKLYMVEKISDYTVYENRFLYMLLCYMRDFIDLRVSKINEAISTYKSDFKMKKSIETKSRVLNFETSLFEDRKDNPYPLLDDKTRNILERINAFSHDVQALLKTDLMQQVSEAPMIKPPITKTNVLKMNNNFKNAVALYEYLNGYDKLGYSLEEVKLNLEPFVDPMSDEIVELVSLTSFLSYKYGNDLEELLKSEYDEEERLRRIEENKRTAEQIKALKKRIKESGMGYEEYMLMLEKHNRQLEKDSADLVVARNEIATLKEQIEGLEKEKRSLEYKIEDLNKTIEEQQKEIERLIQKYIDDMAKKEAEHKAAIEALNAEHANEITELTTKYTNEINELTTKYTTEIAELKASHAKYVSDLNEKHSNEISELMESHDLEIDNLNTLHHEQLVSLEDTYEKEKQEMYNEYSLHISELTNRNEVLTDSNEELTTKLRENEEFLNSETLRMEREKNSLIDECNRSIKDTITSTNKEIMAARALTEAAIEETRYANAKLNAVKKMHGMFTDEDDFTSRERFTELEQQKKAFKKLYKEEWKKTKQRIKRELFELNNPVEKTELEEVLENETLTPEQINEIESEVISEMTQLENDTPIIENVSDEPSIEEIVEPEILEVTEPYEEELDELFVSNPDLEPVIEEEVIEPSEAVMEPILEDEPTIEEILEPIMEEVDEELEESDEETDTKGLVGFNFKDVKFRSLNEKLKTMPEDLATLYNDIKNDFMKYNNVTSKLSKSYDCIYLGRRIVAKLSITSTKVKVYLAVDPNKYNTSQYPHKDLSMKKTHMNTPYFTTVKSPLSIRRIKNVYKDMMNEKGVDVNHSYKSVDYVKALSEE